MFDRRSRERAQEERNAIEAARLNSLAEAAEKMNIAYKRRQEEASRKQEEASRKQLEQLQKFMRSQQIGINRDQHFRAGPQATMPPWMR